MTIPRCHERSCSRPLVSEAALLSGICAPCMRALGAVPSRLPGGGHDAQICLCFLCVDRRRGYSDDFRADRMEREDWA